MKIKFNVHSVSPQPFQVTAELGGKSIEATINGLVVELVTDDGSMSHVVRTTDPKAAELFQTGAVVVATYAKDKD